MEMFDNSTMIYEVESLGTQGFAIIHILIVKKGGKCVRDKNVKIFKISC